MANTIIKEDGFGFVPRPDPNKSRTSYEIVRRYTMTNKNKASVQLISWGAGVQSIKIPNKFGVLGDVLLGFDDMDGYLKNRYMGSIVDVQMDRVSNGKTQINNKICSSTIDGQNEDHLLHDGYIELDNVNWNSYISNNHVVMSHLNRVHNDERTGNMLTQVKYTWTDDNQLHINIRASATQPTPLNITSHCLLNLAGHGTGSKELRKHVVTINADNCPCMSIKENLPTGVTHPVDCTVYDLRLPTQITKDRLYSIPGGGYNHNLRITSPSCWCYRFHARILHPGSGRIMELYSNQPDLLFYTGNDLPDPYRIYPPDLEDYIDNNVTVSLKSPNLTNNAEDKEMWGKGGVKYCTHGGFVMSPRNFMNFESLPSCVLYPGKVYVHDITYNFGVLTKSS